LLAFINVSFKNILNYEKFRNYGVQELDAKEQQEIEGGFLFLAGLILGILAAVMFYHD
jgi:hypothetical protein